jgi:hypothetical protein
VGLPRSDSPPKSETERRGGQPVKMRRRKRHKRPAPQGSSPEPRESRRRAAFRSGGSAAAVLGSLARLRAGRQGADAPPSAPCGPIQQKKTRARRHGCRGRPSKRGAKRTDTQARAGRGCPDGLTVKGQTRSGCGVRAFLLSGPSLKDLEGTSLGPDGLNCWVQRQPSPGTSTPWSTKACDWVDVRQGLLHRRISLRRNE